MKAWQKGLLIVIGVLIVLTIVLALTVYSLLTPTILVRDNSFLALRVSGPLIEHPPANPLLRALTTPGFTVRGILDNIRKARVDKRIVGIILKPSYIPAGWGKIQEIREALADFKTSGKTLVSFLDHCSTKEYYLATVSDRVFMIPTGELFLTGLTAEVTFLKGTLEKLGIKADLEHVGRYKTASDLLTRESMSEAHREVVESILDDYYHRLVETIATARKKAPEEVKAMIDRGPFNPQRALREGLVDSLLYWDELEELLKKENKGKFAKIESSKYSRVSLTSLGLNKGPRIALIYATGAIVTGEDQFDPVFGPCMGSDRVVRDIRRAAENKYIKAIVFRVDSPGGSGLASDIIWREVVKAKEKKPFIVSMSDVAGSGGYWISMAADTIVAQPGTLTGSIGVIGGKICLQGFYNKIGINKEVVTRGRHADSFSETRPFTPEERKKLREELWDFYGMFVHKAAEGRGKTFKEIDAVGRGRVWTGKQALERGLVDVLGGLKEAIDIAKLKAGIPREKEVRLVIYPKKKGLLEVLLSRRLVPLFKNLNQSLSLWRSSKLALMPFWLEIR